MQRAIYVADLLSSYHQYMTQEDAADALPISQWPWMPPIISLCIGFVRCALWLTLRADAWTPVSETELNILKQKALAFSDAMNKVGEIEYEEWEWSFQKRNRKAWEWRKGEIWLY